MGELSRYSKELRPIAEKSGFDPQARHLSLLRVHIGYGTHPASCPINA
jgi:hypothetical protein